MEKFYHETRFGYTEIICENDALISLKFTENPEKSDKETVLSAKIKLQLEEYFSGKRKFFDIKINPKGTDFQKTVWKELLKIPYGKTLSYSQIAKNIGKEKACRAVGFACNKNPAAIIIPCHRVVSKNGGLTGYAYGVDIKEKLLKLEANNL